ncbi:porin [Paracoccus onubensis]|uniref:Porin n=1 Tax=Paracoccus onubensis TaxID=1675788 RepID=A0A418SRD4_9RHOB|nr:porin [Paracoccus onubensis]RJE83489.1 porin [Paracoccus onubensis]
MKKALIASTALALSAGFAAADVTISGYGRTGVQYYENVDGDDRTNESQIVSRLRMNIDASTSTDQGVDFGARFRLQWDQGHGSRGEDAATNAGKLYVTSNGLTVEVGNVDTAFDSNGLIYETELGVYDRSVGFSDRAGSFFTYKSDAYSDVDRVGVRVLYEIDNLIVQGSYVDPDQSGWNEATSTVIDGVKYFHDVEEEYGLSIDYIWNERLELSAAYVMNGAGVKDNDIFFVGARYAVMDNARIGLNYVDASNDGVTGNELDREYVEQGNTIAIYGDYTLADGLTNIEAYVANNDAEWNETDNAFGIGVNYDLGGARLGASLQRDYDERVTADMGVRFDF